MMLAGRFPALASAPASSAPAEPVYPPGLVACIERIARGYGVSPDAVWGRDRRRRSAEARHHAWAVARWTLHLSYPELGRIFGVDHSTVVDAVRRFEYALQEKYR